MRILVTGVGGPTPVSVARSLRAHSRFSSCWMLGVDANPLATGLYRSELFDSVALVPLASASGYWRTVDHLVKKHKIDLAVVQPEQEVLAWSSRQSSEDLPCRALLPDPNLARLLVDKAAMSEALRGSQLVPPSVALDRELSDLANVEDTLAYPFWVRSAVGSSGLGSLLVWDRESLDSWVRINANVEFFLCSEYLPGRNLACKLLYCNGKLLRSALAERVNYIMAKVAPSGVTGNTSFGRFLNEKEPVTRATEAMDVLFDFAGAKKHGFFTVDLKEDGGGNAKVTEVNVRNVAFNGCFAELGANFSEDIVRLLSDDEEFDYGYHQYKFDDDYVFIRDVDVEPRVLKESELLVTDS